MKCGRGRGSKPPSFLAEQFRKLTLPFRKCVTHLMLNEEHVSNRTQNTESNFVVDDVSNRCSVLNRSI